MVKAYTKHEAPKERQPVSGLWLWIGWVLAASVLAAVVAGIFVERAEYTQSRARLGDTTPAQLERPGPQDSNR